MNKRCRDPLFQAHHKNKFQWIKGLNLKDKLTREYWRLYSWPWGRKGFLFFFFKDWLIDWLLCWVFVFCARAFSSCGKRGPLFIAVCGPLTIVASLVAEHRLQMRRLSSCGSRAQLLRGMWDPPRPGLEPVSPALAGRFSTTAPPGKPRKGFLKQVTKLISHKGKD